jgi:hypothetical protein
MLQTGAWTVRLPVRWWVWLAGGRRGCSFDVPAQHGAGERPRIAGELVVDEARTVLGEMKGIADAPLNFGRYVGGFASVIGAVTRAVSDDPHRDHLVRVTLRRCDAHLCGEAILPVGPVRLELCGDPGTEFVRLALRPLAADRPAAGHGW